MWKKFVLNFSPLLLLLLSPKDIKLNFLSTALFCWCFPGGSVVMIHLPMQEMWVWSLGQEDLLEKEIATHSSMLAWEIPCLEWKYMGLQRAGHDLATRKTTTFLLIKEFRIKINKADPSFFFFFFEYYCEITITCFGWNKEAGSSWLLLLYLLNKYVERRHTNLYFMVSLECAFWRLISLFIIFLLPKHIAKCIFSRW